MVDGKASVVGVRKALGEFLLCSGIGVAETDRDGRYDTRDCEQYKPDEAFVIDPSTIGVLWC